MKTYFKSILFLIVLTFTSCIVYTYPTVKYDGYSIWKAEQKANQQRLLEYTQSDEFKKKYEGTSLGNNIDGPAAKSIIGTPNDPFNQIRNAAIGTPIILPTQSVRVNIRY